MNKIKIDNITDKIMDSIADGLSSKQCFVIFLIWSLLPAIFTPPHDFLSWNQYISQSVIQLIALAILGYNSKKEGKTQRKTIDETHNVVYEELGLVKEELNIAKELRIENNKKLDQIIEMLNKQYIK